MDQRITEWSEDRFEALSDQIPEGTVIVKLEGETMRGETSLVIVNHDFEYDDMGHEFNYGPVRTRAGAALEIPLQRNKAGMYLMTTLNKKQIRENEAMELYGIAEPDGNCWRYLDSHKKARYYRLVDHQKK